MDRNPNPRARAPICDRIRRRLAEQAGFGLIEVVVSAALLAVIVLALMAGIDGPARTAARNQSRSIASSVAQQDQDRMRAMRSVDLSDYAPGPRVVTVAGIPYTVQSKGQWTRDQSGTQSCTSNSAVAEYIDLTTTVSWPESKVPITVESLMAPENGAFNLIAQITDEAGKPVVGLPITATGPAGLTRITNSYGCAVFGHAAVGDYTLAFSSAGWVDPAGITNVSVGATVAKGSTATVTHSYAQGATVTASFDTKVGATPSAVNGQAFSVTNAGLPNAQPRVFTAASPQATVASKLLFPFKDGYGAYAGDCAAADPVNNPPAASVNVPTPFGSNQAVTLRLPTLSFTVTRGGSALKNAKVTVAPTGSGCSDPYPNLTTDIAGKASLAAAYGPYAICADDGTRHVNTSVTSNDPNGKAVPSIAIPNAGAKNGVCP